MADGTGEGSAADDHHADVRAGSGDAPSRRDAVISVEAPPHLRVRPALRRSILLAAIGFFLLGLVGSNLGPAWVDQRPAVVLAMSSRNRNLFGSVPYIGVVAYSIIGFVRIMLAGLVLFFLGRWYGRRAIDWMEGERVELPAIFRWFQTGVDKAGWLLVLLMPGSNLVCLMAGHRRMAPARFTVFLALGVALKLWVIWWGGQVFDDQIRSFLDWIEQYQWKIVIALFAITFLQMGNQMRKAWPDIVAELEHPEGSDTNDANSPSTTDEGP